MRTMKLLLCMLSLAFLTPQLAWGQRDRGGRAPNAGGMLFLASQASVQSDLGLKEDQAQEIKKIAQKQREAMRGLRDLSPKERRAKVEAATNGSNESLKGVLSAEQMKRLSQISLQQRGPAAMADPDVAKSLELTDEQREKILTIATEAREKGREIVRAGDRQAANEKMKELRKSTQDSYMAVLSDDQKTKWKEMRGKPFKGKIRRGGEAGRQAEENGNRPRKPKRQKPEA